MCFGNWLNCLSNVFLQFLKQTGYCPQFDGLVDIMTGDEMLFLYCRLRGLPEHQIPAHVKDLIKRLGINYREKMLHLDNIKQFCFLYHPSGLKKHWARRCGNYSGGNKRKLSTAIAMAAEPSILFLDEPTSGVDPVSRRRIWRALTYAINNGQSCVLTSHR